MRNLYIRIRTEEQLEAVAGTLHSIPADNSQVNILVPVSMAEEKVNVLMDCNADLIADLPFVAREDMNDRLAADIKATSWAQGIVIKNIDEMGLIENSGYKGCVIGDSFLYAYNTEAAKFYMEYFPEMLFMASDELTDDELDKLPFRDRVIYKVYGRARVMITAQSMASNYCGKGDMRIESEKHDRFIIADEEYDYSAVYTAEPVNMTDRVSSFNRQRLFADFTTETGAETAEVLAAIINGSAAGSSQQFYRGHHFRGID